LAFARSRSSFLRFRISAIRWARDFSSGGADAR
jgi:hypothetical protein